MAKAKRIKVVSFVPKLVHDKLLKQAELTQDSVSGVIASVLVGIYAKEENTTLTKQEEPPVHKPEAKAETPKKPAKDTRPWKVRALEMLEPYHEIEVQDLGIALRIKLPWNDKWATIEPIEGMPDVHIDALRATLHSIQLQRDVHEVVHMYNEMYYDYTEELPKVLLPGQEWKTIRTKADLEELKEEVEVLGTNGLLTLEDNG